MNNLTVKTKIITSFAFVTALTFIVGILGIVGSYRLNAAYTDTINAFGKPLADIGNALVSFEEARLAVRWSIIYAGNQEEIQKVESSMHKNFHRFETLLKEYKKTIRSAEALQLCNEAESEYYTNYKPTALAAVKAAALETDRDKLVKKYLDINQSSSEIIVDKLFGTMSMKKELLDKISVDCISRSFIMNVISVIVLIIIISISMLLGLYLGNHIGEPLKFITGFMERASVTGDLTFTPDELDMIAKFVQRKDELGYTIASSTNFIKRLVNSGDILQTVANGNLSATISLLSEKDTIGLSLKSVVEIIQQRINEIITAIAEYEQGNMDHKFDTNNLHRAYRHLADNILRLSNLGMTDQLTELPNRRSFDSRLDAEWNRSMREKSTISVLMIDVDKFKDFNDTYGHLQGDLALQTIAKLLSEPLRRAVDLVARWGGEEFAVLLPATNSAGAIHIAEQMRLGIEGADIPSADGGPAKRITISVGVTTLIPTPDKTAADLISQADAALYNAKNTGRNRVCRHEG